MMLLKVIPKEDGCRCFDSPNAQCALYQGVGEEKQSGRLQDTEGEQ